MPVVSRTADTDAVLPYYVSALAGPRIGRRRVAKGEELKLAEPEARAYLASGALVTDEARVDDPWGEAAPAPADDAPAHDDKPAA